MRKKFIILLIIVELLAILSAIAFCFKPMESHQYSGRDLLSDSAISLDGLFDVREKGLYADNSIADSIDIYVPVSALWRGSYNVTVKYIANDGSNTLAVRDDSGSYAGGDLFTDDSDLARITLPANDTDLAFFGTEFSSTRLKDCRITVRYNGNGFLYVYGIEINETNSFRRNVLLNLIGLFLVIDLLLLLFAFLRAKKVFERIDLLLDTYRGDVYMSPGIYKSIVIAFFALSIVLRLWKIGIVPGNGGVNQDEAFAGFEAWSILKYGTDSHGYVNPVYLTVWGSGMSALESCVMMPFVAMFGLTAFSIRVPSAILGICTVYAFYRLFARRECRPLDVIGLIIIAIIPWNVMISRWGLDCDFFPAFVLFGTLFLLKSQDNSKWLMLSALFYGLSLYCYAAPWVVMPFLVAGQALYMILTGRCMWDRYWSIGLIILSVLAFPLILFVAVNIGLIPEIRSSLISIPELDFRGGEVGIHNIARNLRQFYKVVILQDDGLLWNSVGHIGIYFKISIVPGIIGIISSIRTLVKKEERRVVDGLIWIWFACGLILATNLDNNVNRINIIHIPIIYFISVGIAALVRMLYNSKARICIALISGIYVVYLSWFTGYYFGSYSEAFGKEFDKGLSEAIEYAESIDHTRVDIDANYANVLFRTKISTPELNSEENNFWETYSTNEYRISKFVNGEPVSGEVYIGKTEEVADYMAQYGLETKEFGYFTVGY